jgi:RNA-binding protein
MRRTGRARAAPRRLQLGTNAAPTRLRSRVAVHRSHPITRNPMTELTLARDQRLDLRARAHHLDPVVLLGAAGLTDAAMREIDRALTAHELIKVRVPGDDRELRIDMLARIADQLGAARIQAIGKLLVLYRPKPPEPAALAPSKPTRAAPKSRTAPVADAARKPRHAPGAPPPPRRPRAIRR